MNEPVKILLVDDDKFLVDMYSQKFAGAGYTVEACLSAKEAVKLVQGGFTPKVILFDVTMPDMDGFAFLQALKDEHLADDALKIALTNQSSDSEKKKAEELGAVAYFVKASMIPSEVLSAVAEELSKKR